MTSALFNGLFIVLLSLAQVLKAQVLNNLRGGRILPGME